MGCRGCTKKKGLTIQTFKVKINVPENTDIKVITQKLIVYAKELINET